MTSKNGRAAASDDHNSEVELAFLGATMFSDDQSVLDLIPLDCIDPPPGRPKDDDLFEPLLGGTRQPVLRAIIAIHERSQIADLVTVGAELQARGTLAEIGGAAELALMAGHVYAPEMVGDYFRVLLKHRRQRIAKRALRLLSAGYDTWELWKLAQAAMETTEIGRRELSSLRPSQILDLPIVENDCLLGNRLLNRGGVIDFLGPGGIGKSRIVLQVCLSMILGRSIFGWQTCGGVRVQVFQTENSAHRTKTDLGALMHSLSAEERALVDENLEIVVPLTDDDRWLNVGDEDAVARMTRAVRRFGPSVVVFDPLIEFFDGDDENKAIQMRACLRTLAKIARAADPEAAIIILHHSRESKEGISGAVGWESGNFGRGSKALKAFVRAQINIVPATEDDDQHLLVSCGKNNDGPRFEPFGLLLDQRTMRYDLDCDFSLDRWRENLETKRPRGRNNSAPVAIVTAIIQAAPGMGVKYRDLISKIMAAAQCSERTAATVLKQAKDNGLVESVAGIYRCNGV